MKRKTTKQVLTESFRELAAGKAIDRITVQEIVRNRAYFSATFSTHWKRLVVFCMILSVFLSGCAQASHAEVPVLPTLAPLSGLRIAVASDLHFNPDSRPKTSSPAQSEYSLELLDALLYDAGQQGAAFLILTGDLVNGGKPHRHAALVQKLQQAELPVYVLPGNHDLDPVTQSEFAEFYAPFGYNEACSRDPASLSYAVIRDGLLLLMLDTGGYSVGVMDLAEPPADTHAFVSGSTLRWAEELLRRAEAEGLLVLCAGHYNLLPDISRDTGNSGFYFENAEALAGLLRKYHVPLYLSGHAHTRGFYRRDSLCELVTEYLLGYPTAYSVLDIDAKTIRYTPRRIDVEAWAKATGQTDRILLNFAQWQQDGLRGYSDENVRYMSERNPISKTEQQQAADFFYFVMDSFWQGTLHERRREAEAMPGYQPFFRCAEGYAYGWWLKELLETASPELQGFVIERK